MFRVQDNVPSVYINESRDFQLLSRLFDTLFSGVKYDSESIIDLIDAMNCKDRVLSLLATKVGFFPRIEIDSAVLKYIVSSFPKIMKYKGTELGIKEAVYTVLKSENKYYNAKVYVNIHNEKDKPDFGYVDIYVNLTDYNKKALEEVLRYVMPFGFIYRIIMGQKVLDAHSLGDIYSQRDGFSSMITLKVVSSQIRTSDDFNISNDNINAKLNNPFNKMLNNYYTTEIINEDNSQVYGTTQELLQDDSYTKIIDGSEYNASYAERETPQNNAPNYNTIIYQSQSKGTRRKKKS